MYTYINKQISNIYFYIFLIYIIYITSTERKCCYIWWRKTKDDNVRKPNEFISMILVHFLKHTLRFCCSTDWKIVFLKGVQLWHLLTKAVYLELFCPVFYFCTKMLQIHFTSSWCKKNILKMFSSKYKISLLLLLVLSLINLSRLSNPKNLLMWNSICAIVVYKYNSYKRINHHNIKNGTLNVFFRNFKLLFCSKLAVC